MGHDLAVRRDRHRLGERALRAGARSSGAGVVLQMQDLAVLPMPYLVLQDLSYDMLLERFGPGGALHFPGLGADRLRRLRDRQREVYAQATRVLPMSRWMADSLVRHGVPDSRIAVVPPGASALPAAGSPPPDRTARPRRRLLFVGRDFRTKAGDQVVAALAVLRRDLDPDITLTVVGPTTWPGHGPVPEGVRFLGPQPRDVVARLYDEHDLFVLPSRFEGFGISFVEALSRGLPCVGRDDCAMPEIIDDGVTGALVRSDSAEDLASLVASVLVDDVIYRTCRDRAEGIESYYSWDRAAGDIVAVVDAVHETM